MEQSEWSLVRAVVHREPETSDQLGSTLAALGALVFGVEELTGGSGGIQGGAGAEQAQQHLEAAVAKYGAAVLECAVALPEPECRMSSRRFRRALAQVAGGSGLQQRRQHQHRAQQSGNDDDDDNVVNILTSNATAGGGSSSGSGGGERPRGTASKRGNRIDYNPASTQSPRGKTAGDVDAQDEAETYDQFYGYIGLIHAFFMVF